MMTIGALDALQGDVGPVHAIHLAKAGGVGQGKGSPLLVMQLSRGARHRSHRRDSLPL